MNSPSSYAGSLSSHPPKSNNVDANAALRDIKKMLEEIVAKVDVLTASQYQHSTEPTDPRLIRSQSPELTEPEEESLFVPDLSEGRIIEEETVVEEEAVVEQGDNIETGSSVAGQPSPETVTPGTTDDEYRQTTKPKVKKRSRREHSSASPTKIRRAEHIQQHHMPSHAFVDDGAAKRRTQTSPEASKKRRASEQRITKPGTAVKAGQTVERRTPAKKEERKRQMSVGSSSTREIVITSRAPRSNSLGFRCSANCKGSMCDCSWPKVVQRMS
ncbi:hypothetical protein GLAREA_01277 [Glarea lozoyensis ATCC 20868]|uniref:Uncharacterized protein n=1 Tax=Glarea lozoyensis (strain ATCC 20868 / MF5171) TaxID=1116229 RepID=S3CHP0_GLAL2|nr:uncharacterized protein GLAREA_01277 [Glarea lozoyensis ATCC 20868]EPE25365.1 hypothetical protein GLAREA_01277 [Glarea lozoyensis ATCC 20868]